jgi:hypothetical protein
VEVSHLPFDNVAKDVRNAGTPANGVAPDHDVLARRWRPRHVHRVNVRTDAQIDGWVWHSRLVQVVVERRHGQPVSGRAGAVGVQRPHSHLVFGVSVQLGDDKHMTIGSSGDHFVSAFPLVADFVAVDQTVLAFHWRWLPPDDNALEVKFIIS